jgi:hypothetical protein
MFGLDAIAVMKRLEQRFPRNAFRVSVRSREGTEYGYAFRDRQGTAKYEEKAPYK